jgi:hypothetical protein
MEKLKKTTKIYRGRVLDIVSHASMLFIPFNRKENHVVLRVVEGDEKEPGIWGDNWATLLLGGT